MAAIRSALDLRDLPYTETTNQGGWISRALAAVWAARMRQAEREVEHYLAGTGGKFTDQAEREIERRFLSNQSRW